MLRCVLVYITIMAYVLKPAYGFSWNPLNWFTTKTPDPVHAYTAVAFADQYMNNSYFPMVIKHDSRIIGSRNYYSKAVLFETVNFDDIIRTITYFGTSNQAVKDRIAGIPISKTQKRYEDTDTKLQSSISLEDAKGSLYKYWLHVNKPEDKLWQVAFVIAGVDFDGVSEIDYTTQQFQVKIGEKTICKKKGDTTTKIVKDVDCGWLWCAKHRKTITQKGDETCRTIPQYETREETIKINKPVDIDGRQFVDGVESKYRDVIIDLRRKGQIVSNSDKREM
eukprot:370099_1